MNRQKIKYLMFLAFNLTGALSSYLFVMGCIHYKSSAQFLSDGYPFMFYLISFLIFVFRHIDGTSYSKRMSISTFIYPKLPKKILHESGEYYIKYDKHDKYYDVYIDNYFRLKTLFRVDDDFINSPDDILRKVKEELDSMYKGEMNKINRIKQKENVLKNWDGYTSIREKRDNKIDQVIR